MSQEWTLANVFSVRARERAGSAPIVAGSHSWTHAHGNGPVLVGCTARGTAGETARSVSPEGLNRSGDVTVVGGQGPLPHRGTRRENGSRRGQTLPVTQPLENQLRARPAAARDVGSTALPSDALGELRRDCAACVDTVEGAANTTGGELTELAPEMAVAADSEDPNPALHTIDASPTTGSGKATRRRERGRARSRPTTLP